MNAVIDVPVFEGCNATVPVPVRKGLRIHEGAVPPPGHGMFHVMNPKDGDKRVVWNRDSLAEIQAAKEMFDDLKREGMNPYKVGTGGKATSEVMDEFDPMAEQVIFAPGKKLLAGG